MKRQWIILLAIAAVGWLVHLLSPILPPFLFGALLAYLGDPVCDRLEAKGLSRTLAVTVVFVAFTLVGALVLLALVPMVIEQFVIIKNKVPDYVVRINGEFIPLLQAKTGLDFSQFVEQVKASGFSMAQHLGKLSVNVLNTFSKSSAFIAAFVGNLLLTPVVTFYLLRDWDLFIARLEHLLPRKWHRTVVDLVEECDEVIGAFIRGQLLVMCALGIIYALGLRMVGLELGLLIGFTAGVASIVPYLGTVVGVVMAVAAWLLQTQDPTGLIYIAIVFGVGQAIEGMVLTPLLVGDKIGMHPVAVIFSVLAGGQLFGFTGVLLALPVAAVITVWLRYLYRQYMDSELYEERTSEGDG